MFYLNNAKWNSFMKKEYFSHFLRADGLKNTESSFVSDKISIQPIEHFLSLIQHFRKFSIISLFRAERRQKAKIEPVDLILLAFFPSFHVVVTEEWLFLEQMVACSFFPNETHLLRNWELSTGGCF